MGRLYPRIYSRHAIGYQVGNWAFGGLGSSGAKQLQTSQSGERDSRWATPAIFQAAEGPRWTHLARSAGAWPRAAPYLNSVRSTSLAVQWFISEAK